jgi:LPS sulfotransferase NodH
MKKLAVLATQRTGSTALCSFLDSHPNLFWGQEILAHNKKHLKQRVEMFYDIMNMTFFSRDDIKGVGTKLMYNQIERSRGSVWEWLILNNVKIIHLKRKDDLARQLSQEINVRKKELGRTAHSKQTPSPVKIELDPQEVAQNIKRKRIREQRWDNRLNNYPHVDITYEEMTNGGKNTNEMPVKTAMKLLNFIGVSYHPLTTSFVKQNPQPPEDIITNYQEVFDYLKEEKII